MEIIKEGKLNKLISSDGYSFKVKDDNYKDAYIDEDGNIVEEHLPEAFKFAYLPSTMTLEMVQEMFDELLDSEYPWKPQEITVEEIENLWEEAVINGIK